MLDEDGEIECWGYGRDYKNDVPVGTYLQIEQVYNFRSFTEK